MLSHGTVALLRWYAAYWETYPEHTVVDSSFLRSLIRLRCEGMDRDTVAITLQLAEELDKPEDKEAIAGLVGKLYELDLSGKAGAIIHAYNNGNEVDLAFLLQQAATTTRRNMIDGVEAKWCRTSLADLLAHEADEGGLQFTAMRPLAMSIKGLQPGDNIAIAAPTDKGKTSLLCRFASDWQVQARTMFKDRPLLYLVNEGTADRIKLRLAQTALGVDRVTLNTLVASGEADARIAELWGSEDLMRVVNIHGKSLPQVINMVGQHNPYMVISDMTGRIRAASNKGGAANDIGQLEEVWNCLREEAVVQNYVHCGVVQVSYEGMDMLYPPLSAMQNSKTGIQTTLDLCVMMGALNNPMHQFLRGIATPKNKLARQGVASLIQFEAMFNPPINQWKECT